MPQVLELDDDVSFWNRLLSGRAALFAWTFVLAALKLVGSSMLC